MASRTTFLLGSSMAAAAFLSRLPRLQRSPSIFASVVHESTPWVSPLPISSVSELPFSMSGLRYVSTLRRPPVRKGQNIGARARQLQNRRLWTYALTFSCVAGFIVIVLANFQDQMVFYVTPTDALEKFRTNPSKNRLRVGGLVLEGSIVQPASSPEMEFVVTDLINDILVKYEGSLPDLFREGHSVVVEGLVKPLPKEGDEQFKSSGRAVSEKARSGDCYLAAIEVLAKHDEKYMPKEVAAAIEKNKAILEAERQQEEEKNRGI
ncbi:cytochrome c-type biogenesis protein CcmE homolog, mitochondrial [Aristolochia californica]|uniref:cytochrome c-type biogenesis protein CcmE homolog, mitochondrial n=1 Tax=Aristolochia californica TaxID=171875 RepID=UPI0035DE7024